MKEGSLPDPGAVEEIPRLPAAVFLNYARADRELAEWLRDRLRDAGASVWLDTGEIEGGDRWKDSIDKALWQRQLVVAVVTRRSIGLERRWVRYEQERARQLLKPIVPCLFEEGESFLAEGLLPEELQPLHVVRFVPNRDQGLAELIDAIRARLRRYGKKLGNEAAGIEHAFVGREQDLRDLDRMLREQILRPTGRQAIGIVGMGGLGKTMLAEELLRRLSSDFPGGILIESRASGALSAAAVMRRWVEIALGKPPERIYSESEVRALLATFGELLVLLDDVAESDLPQTQALLRALPLDATRIVTTRREDLCRALGAAEHQLEPLTPADGRALVVDRLRDHFGARLRSEGADFDAELRPHEGSIGRLVEIVGAHPLALDLAIGTCDYLDEIPLTLERFSASLRQGIKEFTRGLAFDSSDKNQSLARSLEESLEDLERHDRDAGTDWTSRFRALGVLPDGARSLRELLFALWGDREEEAADADAAWKALSRRAMLRVGHRGLYFYNHPVIRAFAVGLLEQKNEEALAVKERYRRWVVDTATVAFRHPEAKWAEHRFLVEHIREVRLDLTAEIVRQAGPLEGVASPEPLAGATREALEKTGASTLELGMDLALALEQRVIQRPQWAKEGLMCLYLGLACARGQNDAAREAAFLHGLGRALSKSEPPLAQRYFENALALAASRSDESLVATVRSYLGELERTLGHWDKAMELLAQALLQHRRSSNQALEAITLISVGEVLWRQTEFDAARDHYRQALAIYQAAGNLSGVANCYNKLGSVEFERGEHEAATPMFEKALELHKQLGDEAMEAEDKSDLGASYRYRGNHEKAIELLREACEINERMFNRRNESYARANLAATLIDAGRFGEALEEIVDARKAAVEVGDPIAVTFATADHGLVLQGLGRPQEAEELLRAALDKAHTVKSPRSLAGVLGMLAALLAGQPARRAEARDFAREAVRIAEEHQLRQVFGGRRLADLRHLLAGLEDTE